MEASALRYSGGVGLQARSPLLRLQSDDKLISLTRRGNQAAFEVLVSRYQARLLAFCRHLLGSKEDAEDVLQDVLAAAFNALLADDRPINVRPWLYRIARNRSLNHLRKASAVGVDSMDVHFSEHGATTADKVAQREQFRLLVGDIQELPETQRTALILREMEALSYEQIAEAMETTVPGVKSLLVRARISLAEAAEARQLSCSEVRFELGEIAEGLQRKPTAPVRRHLKSCTRCTSFQGQLKTTGRALGLLLPLGPLAVLKRVIVAHIGHSAGSSSGAAGAGAGGTSAAGAGAVGAAGAGVPVAAAGAGAGSATGLLSAGAAGLAAKAAAGLAAAMVVTGGAVEVDHLVVHHRSQGPSVAAVPVLPQHPVSASEVSSVTGSVAGKRHHIKQKAGSASAAAVIQPVKLKTGKTAAGSKAEAGTGTAHHGSSSQTQHHKKVSPPPGRTQTQTDSTALPGTGSSKSTSGSADKGSSSSASSTSAKGSAHKSSSPAGRSHRRTKRTGKSAT